MAEQPEGTGENMNSALNLWQEAVEKAGVDLEKIGNNSVEQLARYSEELEKSLAAQLTSRSPSKTFSAASKLLSQSSPISRTTRKCVSRHSCKATEKRLPSWLFQPPTR
jgi:hypothetical protein